MPLFNIEEHGVVEDHRGRPGAGEITQLLQSWSSGDPAALGQILPIVYEDLRLIARQQLGREPPGHTLQATALVNEVYLSLHRRRSVQWKNRQHFFATLAQMMRRILVDHARRRLTAKRGSGDADLSLEELPHVFLEVEPREWIVLDQALEELTALDVRKSQVVHLRFFFGLTLRETAQVLDISINTVDRDWHHAKLWLRSFIRGEEPE